MKKEYVIIDKTGLHARPASNLVQEAIKHSNNITLKYQDKAVTLKSILLVMSLGIPSGSKIIIDVEGENPEEVLLSLEKVLLEHKLI